MADGADLIQAISILSVQPGDVVVIKSNDCLSLDAAARIREVAKSAIPENEVVVLCDGLDIEILRKVAAE